MPRPTPRSLAIATFALYASLSLTDALPAQDSTGTPAPARTSPRLPPLPAIDTWLDTAALRAGLADVPSHGDPRRAMHIVWVSWDSAGAPRVSTVAAGPAVSAAWSDTVVALLRAHLRPIAAEAPSRGTHLFIESGPEARVEVTEVTQTTVRVAEPGRLQALLGREVQRLLSVDPTLTGSTYRVRVTGTVSTDGLMESPTILVSSGEATLDELALRIVRRTRFVVATIEGIPVRSRAVLPIAFVFPE
jgi:TonB family protein